MDSPSATQILSAQANAPDIYRTIRKNWSGDEDLALKKGVSAFGERNWKSVAAVVRTRNHTQCMQRWSKALKPGLKKGHWTDEEDYILRTKAAEYGKNWAKVVKHISGRTVKQIRERWSNHVNPIINHEPFTEQEDTILVKMHEQVGNKWAFISKKLNSRTPEGVKIRWKSLCRKSKQEMRRQEQQLQHDHMGQYHQQQQATNPTKRGSPTPPNRTSAVKRTKVSPPVLARSMSEIVSSPPVLPRSMSEIVSMKFEKPIPVRKSGSRIIPSANGSRRYSASFSQAIRGSAYLQEQQQQQQQQQRHSDEAEEDLGALVMELEAIEEAQKTTTATKQHRRDMQRPAKRHALEPLTASLRNLLLDDSFSDMYATDASEDEDEDDTDDLLVVVADEENSKENSKSSANTILAHDLDYLFNCLDEVVAASLPAVAVI